MANSDVIGAEVMKRPTLVSYDNYLDAQAAVDKLSDSHFPVQHVAIVGVDLRLVESVLGRMSWGRAALGGMATFMWFGVLIGLFVSFFGSQNGQAFQLIILGLLFGAAFGIVFGIVSYAFTGGKRDFVSRQALQADRYDVLCDQEVIGKARQVLGLAPAWPPAAPPTTASPPAVTTPPSSSPAGPPSTPPPRDPPASPPTTPPVSPPATPPAGPPTSPGATPPLTPPSSAPPTPPTPPPTARGPMGPDQPGTPG